MMREISFSRYCIGAAVILFTLGIFAGCEEPVVSDFEPPDITILSPHDEASFTVYEHSPSAEITIVAEVTDNEALAEVECKAGSESLEPESTDPYTWVWSTSGSAGYIQYYQIRIHARDAAGNERIRSIRIAITLLLTGKVFWVNSTLDRVDSNQGDGECNDGSGDCTLRAAIEEANAGFDLDTIAFNIPGPGPHTIRPLAALPPVVEPLVIDGTTEPDFAGAPVIELDCSQVMDNEPGLQILAGNCVVRGMVINRSIDYGINILDGGGNRIEGNYIGTDVTGTIALGNGSGGLGVGTPDNIIGGLTEEQRNVISGNGSNGIDLSGRRNLVQGNYIGTDATGTGDLGNENAGIMVSGPDNLVGGATPQARNIISGNLEGVTFIEGATGTRVQGNFIGTAAAGTGSVPNTVGVLLLESGNTIGGLSAGAGNLISNNGVGVVMGTPDLPSITGNRVLSNSIFSNDGLGIDLGDDGATLNDAGDYDTGPNNLQNYPEIESVAIDTSGDLIITYKVDSNQINSAYPLTVQFFITDSRWEREGKILLGTDTYTADERDKTANLGQAIDLGFYAEDYVVATATDADGNTSEFSRAK